MSRETWVTHGEETWVTHFNEEEYMYAYGFSTVCLMTKMKNAIP
ncbi:MAG: hypothetical protein ACI4PO_08690 [Faecousia sp.]